MEMKLELVSVPVSDVDRAKAFYTDQVGFNADHDHRVSEDVRFVQLTPPGSACSIVIGQGSRKANRAAPRVFSSWSRVRTARAPSCWSTASKSARYRSLPGVDSCSSATRMGTSGPCRSSQSADDQLTRGFGTRPAPARTGFPQSPCRSPSELRDG